MLLMRQSFGAVSNAWAWQSNRAIVDGDITYSVSGWRNWNTDAFIAQPDGDQSTPPGALVVKRNGDYSQIDAKYVGTILSQPQGVGGAVYQDAAGNYYGIKWGTDDIVPLALDPATIATYIHSTAVAASERKPDTLMGKLMIAVAIYFGAGYLSDWIASTAATAGADAAASGLADELYAQSLLSEQAATAVTELTSGEAMLNDAVISASQQAAADAAAQGLSEAAINEAAQSAANQVIDEAAKAAIKTVTDADNFGQTLQDAIDVAKAQGAPLPVPDVPLPEFITPPPLDLPPMPPLTIAPALALPWTLPGAGSAGAAASLLKLVTGKSIVPINPATHAPFQIDPKTGLPIASSANSGMLPLLAMAVVALFVLKGK